MSHWSGAYHNFKQWPSNHRSMLPFARNPRGSGPLASAIDRQSPTTFHEKRVTARWALGMRRRFHASRGSEGREGRVSSKSRPDLINPAGGKSAQGRPVSAEYEGP